MYTEMAAAGVAILNLLKNMTLFCAVELMETEAKTNFWLNDIYLLIYNSSMHL